MKMVMRALLSKRIQLGVLALQAALLMSSLPLWGQSTSRVDSATITFSNPALGFQAELKGTIQWPKQSGKHPLVVFIHGSGKGTRYEYKNLFPYFLQKGLAVFSYDKRGVGASTGSYNGVGPKNSPMMIPLLASDAYEAIEVIKKREEIDSTKIILCGASQAGWIIPVVASMSKAVSQYVILSGTTVTVGEEIFYSRFAEDGGHTIEYAVDKMNHYPGLKGFDPVPYISHLKQKGLWIFGGKDTSIPTERSIQILDSFDKASKDKHTIKLYPEAGHGLVNNKTGKPEDFIPYLLDWLEKNMKR